MIFNPELHHRQTIRLAGFDYACAGFYFVTICVQKRQMLFGEISAGQMVLNEAGQQVEETWLAMPRHYPGISVDVHRVMPNHFHGIVILHPPVGTGPRACPGFSCSRARPGYSSHRNQKSILE